MLDTASYPAGTSKRGDLGHRGPSGVSRGEAWYDGWLEAWRKDDDGWRAFVRYTVGVAPHLEWVSAGRLLSA